MDIIHKKIIAECAKIIPGLSEQKNNSTGMNLFDAVLPCQITIEGLVGEYGKIQRTSNDSESFIIPGDVIIKRLNPDCAVVFEDESVQALPSANLFVIRPNSDILDSYYLAFILDSSKTLSRISQRSGIDTKVSAISMTQIANCEIPLPTLEQQRRIGELWQCAKKRNRLLHEMISENNNLIRSISENLYQ
ncbi:MAG: restriction endonuclease subunit S [Lentisphaeria bacterium]|nr:restriction endonuclease subunit S [Lentisphaeria bacterium]